jgi:hypothetical protein
MSCNKEIGTVIQFDTHWELPEGVKSGTIAGYDLWRSKYLVTVHNWNNQPMESVTTWIFPAKPEVKK